MLTHARCGFDSFFVDKDVTLMTTYPALSHVLVSWQTESTRRWYELTSLHFPPPCFHVNYFGLEIYAQMDKYLYSGCLSDLLWVWQQHEAVLLKTSANIHHVASNEPHSLLTGSCQEVWEQSWNHTKETQHTGWIFSYTTTVCIDILTLLWYLSKMEYANLLGNAACPIGF